MNDQEWIAAVREYCIKYNIPHEYLAQIINDPKVVPMIRGKAFEFSAMLYLESVLPAADWIVDKPVMNAQFGFHDMDVRVVHKASWPSAPAGIVLPAIAASICWDSSV